MNSGGSHVASLGGSRLMLSNVVRYHGYCGAMNIGMSGLSMCAYFYPMHAQRLSCVSMVIHEFIY